MHKARIFLFLDCRKLSNIRRKNLGVSLGALSELTSILEPDSLANTSLHYLIHAAENHPGSEQFNCCHHCPNLICSYFKRLSTDLHAFFFRVNSRLDELKYGPDTTSHYV
jgi:hypothetical protein